MSEEKNALLHRKEVKARIAFEQATPSRKDIQKEAAAKLGADAKLVLVTRVTPDIGSSSAQVEIKVYEDAKVMDAVEHDYMMKRNAPKTEKKEGEAAPAE
ncbi:hypothetical protein JW711_00730 [Candidatus Woesearchaeota archaeon]|nr:hypothetical protein [Candidatus Woesearchaeota archaeon]